MVAFGFPARPRRLPRPATRRAVSGRLRRRARRAARRDRELRRRRFAVERHHDPPAARSTARERDRSTCGWRCWPRSTEALRSDRARSTTRSRSTSTVPTTPQRPPSSFSGELGESVRPDAEGNSSPGAGGPATRPRRPRGRRAPRNAAAAATRPPAPRRPRRRGRGPAVNARAAATRTDCQHERADCLRRAGRRRRRRRPARRGRSAARHPARPSLIDVSKACARAATRGRRACRRDGPVHRLLRPAEIQALVFRTRR